MKKKAWILTVNMGYGHMRAAFPLKDIAHKRIIIVNDDPLVPQKEKKIWLKSQKFYEQVSRLNEIPLLGKATFGLYDNLQKISPFFPFKDRSKSNLIVKKLKKFILKNKICKSLIEEIKKTNLPIISTHFIPSLACEYYGIKNKIYTIITDTDLNRIWVSDKAKESNITYLAPCQHAVMRLRQYGIKEKNIILTGFPLPKESLGNNLEIAKKNLARRLINLDPKKEFYKKNQPLINKTLNIKNKQSTNLTITYLVGGAGAQKEIGFKILKQFSNSIKDNKINLNLVAGTNKKIANEFLKKVIELKLESNLKHELKIIYEKTKEEYFLRLPEILNNTDIIWTKPSEMSFYTGLGIPILMSKPLGAHEKFNKEWLEHMGSGIMQEDPNFVTDWLYYWLNSGRFAQAAIEGFLDAPNKGTYEIEKLI